MVGFFKRLKEWLFGDSTDATRRVANAVPPRDAANAPVVEASVKPTPKKHSGSIRKPYYVQIGFDFGTAFCKCVCRDVLLDKAWIHLPQGSRQTAMPFLIPSVVSFDGNILRSPATVDGYGSGDLYHAKMALQRIGLRDWENPVLAPYRAMMKGCTGIGLTEFVEMCSIYLISGAIGNIRREVAVRFPGSVEGDLLAINMAVPVADANHPDVNSLFDRVLRRAWVLADELAGYPPISHEELASSISAKANEADSESVRETCFIYPEVSANVQGFVRSRTSSPGLYLFSDTGAGTVDQSVFLFGRPNDEDHLTYLHAEVFPYGSSHIERLAAHEDRNGSTENLERWRRRKEAGENPRQLQAARAWVGTQLRKGSLKTIACSMQKLIRPRQIDSLRVIFGGGGHSEHPYRRAVIDQFNSNLFRRDEIHNRRRAGDSFELGMPIPQDLQLSEKQRKWMDRLTVAYGLSFDKGQLATFTLPSDVPHPTEEQRGRPIRVRPEAPSKDDV